MSVTPIEMKRDALQKALDSLKRAVRAKGLDVLLLDASDELDRELKIIKKDRRPLKKERLAIMVDAIDLVTR